MSWGASKQYVKAHFSYKVATKHGVVELQFSKQRDSCSMIDMVADKHMN